MSCCGGGSSQNQAAAAAAKSGGGAGKIVGYLVQLDDGRQATYLTQQEADQARLALGASKPVQAVYSVG